MKFEEINRAFTDMVATYMRKGYTINSGTMSGSQGEMAKVDMTNGKELIRIYLEKFSYWRDPETGKYFWFDGVRLTVGRCKDEIPVNSDDTWHVFWMDHMEVIYQNEFYRVSGRSGWYITKKQALEVQAKREARSESRRIRKSPNLPEAAKEIVLPFMRRQHRCKSITLKEIAAVTKATDNGKVSYYVHAKGNTYRLH